MKKLLTVLITLFSAPLIHPMEHVRPSFHNYGETDISSENAEQVNPPEKLAFARPPSIIAQTPLGRITQMQVDEAIISYSLERDNEPTILVEFDAKQKQFSGKTIFETFASNGMHLCSTRYPIANQAEVENLFNQYEKTFNATSDKTDGCSIQ